MAGLRKVGRGKVWPPGENGRLVPEAQHGRERPGVQTAPWGGPAAASPLTPERRAAPRPGAFSTRPRLGGAPPQIRPERLPRCLASRRESPRASSPVTWFSESPASGPLIFKPGFFDAELPPSPNGRAFQGDQVGLLPNSRSCSAPAKPWERFHSPLSPCHSPVTPRKLLFAQKLLKNSPGCHVLAWTANPTELQFGGRGVGSPELACSWRRSRRGLVGERHSLETFGSFGNLGDHVRKEAYPLPSAVCSPGSPSMPHALELFLGVCSLFIRAERRRSPGYPVRLWHPRVSNASSGLSHKSGVFLPS
ncbi:uncharacterized protein LOC111523440 [Piliocolobus tephrosceles]|uniref:uncharacterized protein LOC111523440 n=1 Tax=Piliocolobus tephrosceles TaxID=591936 RepID=UPI00130199EB|nr:uncharacterized protein LOC111523440 [Piliocolobus tephrosceles]